MPQKTAAYLLEKYQTGTCSPDEKKIVEDYIIYEGITQNKLSTAELDGHMNDLTSRLHKMPVKIKIWPYLTTAAAVILLISNFLLFNNSPEDDLSVSELTNKTNIQPGKNTATLTMGNGKTITLSNAKMGVVIGDKGLTYNDGSEVASQRDASRNDLLEITAATPKGGTYQVTLPDGTDVWLNAASSIRFPSRFSNKDRKVFLEGEAYFEVFKDRQHPFIVEVANQYIKVLGTHFNVTAYKEDSEIKTTLLEGAVETSGIVLKPGEQSVQSQDKIKVARVNTRIAMAWKNGEFMFSNERLETIMRKISRWYNVEISYKTPALKNELFSGTISRYGNASEVLQMLELTGTVHFRIEGRRITIMK